jgi:hypothetical protein
MRKRPALDHLAVEGQENGAHGIGGFRIGDDHLVDRLRVGFNLVPDTEDLEHLRCSSDDGGGARVPLPDAFRRRLDNGDVEMRSGLLDRHGSGKTDITRSNNQHVPHSVKSRFL